MFKTVRKLIVTILLFAPLYGFSQTSGTGSDDEYVLLRDNYIDGNMDDWFRVGQTQPTIVQANMPPIENFAMGWSWSNAAVLKNFDSVTLENTSDFVELKIDISYLAIRSGFETGLKLALYDSQDSKLLNNTDIITPELKDDVGYALYKRVDADRSDLMLHGNTEFNKKLGDRSYSVLDTGTTFMKPKTNTAYEASIKITRLQTGGLWILLSFDGNLVSHIVPVEDVLTYTFDQVGVHPFFNEYSNKAIIDNVEITSNIPPNSPPITPPNNPTNETYTFVDDTFSNGKLNSWYRIGERSPEIATASTSPLSDFALAWSWSNAALLKNFSEVTLTNEGDFIELNLDFSYISVRRGFDTGLAMALYDSAGTKIQLSSDSLLNAGSDDTGYRFYKNINSSSQDLNLYKDSMLTPTIHDGNPSLLSSNSSGSEIETGVGYEAQLRITRLENGDLLLETDFDGRQNSYTVPSSTVATYTFSEAVIHPFAGEFSNRALIDNVQIYSNVLPTPHLYDFNDGQYSDWHRVGQTQPQLVELSSEPTTDIALGWYWSNAAILKNISAVNLDKVGDYIEVSCDILYTSIREFYDTGLSLALYDSKGTHVNFNSDDLPAAGLDDVGYKFYKRVDVDTQDIGFYSNQEFGATIAKGNPNLLASGTSGIDINLNSAYRVGFRITRQENGALELASNFGGSSHVHTIPADQVQTYTFDEIGIHPFANEYSDKALIDNIKVDSNVVPASESEMQWLEKPPVLEDPLIVSNYDLYGTGEVRIIDGKGRDILLLAHAPTGNPEVLKNVQITVQGFRKLHIKGLDLEIDDPAYARNKALLVRTHWKPDDMSEEVFIEGVRIDNNFTHPNTDALSVYYLGTDAKPISRFVIQKTRIAGVGTQGLSDGDGVHPDLMQFQGGVYIDSVIFEKFTGTTMYQGIFAPWSENSSFAKQSSWDFREVNIRSEDRNTNRLLVTQNEGFSAETYPVTSFKDVFLSQTQSHQFGVGSANIHVNPNLRDDSPYEFVPEARITGTPTPGLSEVDFAPREEVGIYYVSPHE